MSQETKFKQGHNKSKQQLLSTSGMSTPPLFLQGAGVCNNPTLYNRGNVSLALQDFLALKKKEQFLGTQPILIPYISKVGDDEVESLMQDEEEEKKLEFLREEFCSNGQIKSKPKEGDHRYQRNKQGGLEFLSGGSIDSEENEAEERKETEQMPITKDLHDFFLQGVSTQRFNSTMKDQNDLRMEIIKSQNKFLLNSAKMDEDDEEDDGLENDNFNVDDDDEDGCADIDLDEAIEMKGIDKECNDLERTMAQNMIRRSVVRKKLNWSQQFNQGINHHKRNDRLESIQKSFQETQQLKFGKQFQSKNVNTQLPPTQGNTQKKQSQNINNKKHQYQMSQGNLPSNAPLLIDLSLAGKDLKFITPNLLSSNLKLIELQNNKLESLPEEICNLKSLEKLNIDKNLIKKLPSGIWLLNSLTSLSASHNQIEELPTGFDCLNKLETFFINDNKLSNLPSRIGQLQNLKKLLIHNNMLSTIPIEIHRLQKLKEFSLDWFIYLNPPMQKIMRDSKGQIIIEQIKVFCRQFTPPNLSIAQALECQFRSFGDFLLYFHQIKPQEINTVTFGIKQRGIVHQICINGHIHLLQNIVCPRQPQQELSSSVAIKDYLDLNLKDKEGSTPIFFAFRANNQELIEKMIGLENSKFSSYLSKKINMDIVNPKLGCPLHLCILKHKFNFATALLRQNLANPHITNPNGSNAMHILFANYQFDNDNAESLALQLLSQKVNINLIDNNGLSPLHVAIKKQQLQALQFAANHNKSVKTRLDLYAKKQSQFNSNCYFSNQSFDFNLKGKKGFTLLHYTILKNNSEAFFFLLKHGLVDIFLKDDLCRTPRGLSLINSPLYKVLYKLEKYEALRRSLNPQKQHQNQTITPIQQKPQFIKHTFQAKSLDLTNKFQPQDQPKIASASVHKKFQNESIPYTEIGDNIKHININRRQIQKQNAENCIQNQEYQAQANNFHSVNPSHKHKSLFQRVQNNSNSKQKGKTLDRLQAQKLLDQIQGGLTNQIKGLNIIEEQDPTLNQSKQQQPTSFNEKIQNVKVFNQSKQNSKQKQGKGGIINGNMQKLNNESNLKQQATPQNNMGLQGYININVNLNINISIPPTPRSTRGNGSRIDSIQSFDDNKDHPFQNANKEIMSNHKGIMGLGHMLQDIINESVRKEDLSIIDDEVPIKSEINKNLQFKYNAVNQFSNSKQKRHPINSSLHNMSKLKDDIINQSLSNAIHKLSNNKVPQESRRQTQQLNETQLTLQQQTIENSFKGQIEDNTKRKIKNEELSMNKFHKEYGIIVESKIGSSSHQEMIYQKINSIYTIIATQLVDTSIKQDAIQLISQILQQVEVKDSIKIDICYLLQFIQQPEFLQSNFLQNILYNTLERTQSIRNTQKDKFIYSLKLLEYECINSWKIREVLNKKAIEKFPSKSQKLNQYLRSIKMSQDNAKKYIINDKQQMNQKKNIDEKYFTNGSDTIEEIFEITTERNQYIQNNRHGQIFSQQQMLSPTFTNKEIIFNQIRNLNININSNVFAESSQNQSKHSQNQMSKQQSPIKNEKNLPQNSKAKKIFGTKELKLQKEDKETYNKMLPQQKSLIKRVLSK